MYKYVHIYIVEEDKPIQAVATEAIEVETVNTTLCRSNISYNTTKIN